jgi:DNA primase
MILDAARATHILDEVKRRGGLGLKRVGAELIGPCPRCGGHDRFAVSPRKGVFLCRGCGAKGDVIAFVEHVDGIGFGDAVRLLTNADRIATPPPRIKTEKHPRGAAIGSAIGHVDDRSASRRA